MKVIFSLKIGVLNFMELSEQLRELCVLYLVYDLYSYAQLDSASY
jgi:hypothetical protein